MKPQTDKPSRSQNFTGKLDLWKSLLNVSTDTDFVNAVLKDEEWSPSDVDSIRRSLPKWRAGTQPSRDPAPRFFSVLAGKLPTCNTVSWEALLKWDIKQYVKNLQTTDPSIAAKLRSIDLIEFSVPEKDLAPPSVNESRMLRHSESGFHIFWNRDQGPVETIKDCLKVGRLDQRHYYINPDSANAWSDLVSTGFYPTYRDCKASLEVLVESAEWREARASLGPSTIVMLAGGGAPTKDLVLLQDLLTPPNERGRLNLCLVDISWFMLENSRRSILEHASTLGFSERVEVTPIRENLLNMTEESCAQFHKADGAAVFAITGGTIGNFSEAAFFRSVNRVARKGDLLIISADTIDDPSPENKAAIISKYNNDALRQYLQPVVSEVLIAAQLKESVDEALASVHAELLDPEHEDNESNVPGSYCVVLTLPRDPRPLILLTSTRYNSSALQAYAKRFHWASICQISKKPGYSFKQFLFRKH